MDEADRAKHFVNPADVGGQIYNSGTSSQNQQVKQGVKSNFKYFLPDLSGVSISEKPQPGPKLMLNVDNQQGQQQRPVQTQQTQITSQPLRLNNNKSQ